MNHFAALKKALKTKDITANDKIQNSDATIKYNLTS